MTRAQQAEKLLQDAMAIILEFRRVSPAEPVQTRDWIERVSRFLSTAPTTLGGHREAV